MKKNPYLDNAILYYNKGASGPAMDSSQIAIAQALTEISDALAQIADTLAAMEAWQRSLTGVHITEERIKLTTSNQPKAKP